MGIKINKKLPPITNCVGPYHYPVRNKYIDRMRVNKVAGIKCFYSKFKDYLLLDLIVSVETYLCSGSNNNFYFPNNLYTTG